LITKNPSETRRGDNHGRLCDTDPACTGYAEPESWRRVMGTWITIFLRMLACQMRTVAVPSAGAPIGPVLIVNGRFLDENPHSRGS
jgi:hypothetical protein